MDAAPIVDATLPDAAPPAPPALPVIIGPAAAVDEDPDPKVVAITLAADHHGNPITRDVEVDGYAYNGQSPGPIIQARLGDEIVVRFTNHLDEPTTIHWHGLRITDDMDGSPASRRPSSPARRSPTASAPRAGFTGTTPMSAPTSRSSSASTACSSCTRPSRRPSTPSAPSSLDILLSGRPVAAFIGQLPRADARPHEAPS
ncbi:MAG: multicopper oxidase domain-containing protein [bacterium]